MGKMSKSGLTFGVGSSPQYSIVQVYYDQKLLDLYSKESMIKELINLKVKFNPKQLIFTAKDKNNQTIWLEEGNENVGLSHIYEHHKEDFFNEHNVKKDAIVTHLYNIITNGSIEYSRVTYKNGKEGIEKLYKYEGKNYLLTGIGTNGFLVSAYPINEKRAIKLKERYK